METRKPYLTNVSDEEWAFVAPYLILLPLDAEQRKHDLREVVKLPEAKRGFVLLPRRWVVERSFGWMARFRRLAKDYERLTTTLVGLHFVAFACLLLHRANPLLVGGS